MGFSCLGFVQLLKSVGLCLLPKLGRFQPVFPQIGLYHFTLSPFFLGSRDMNVRPFVSVPRVSEALFILPHLFFFSFCCLDWMIPFDLSSSSLSLSCFVPILPLSPSSKFYISGIVSISSKISI